MKLRKIGKRFLALFISLCLMSTVLTGLTLPVAAATSSYFTYTVTDGKATITDCDTLISGDVTIPSTIDGYTVTGIGSKAFYGCITLTSVIIPDSVTNIGTYAFYGCSGLKSVTIGNGAKSIGKSAFYGCSSLENVVIGNSVKSIGVQAFYECVELASINVPDSVTSIGEQAFYKCSKLASINIPNSVTSIREQAFYKCIRLTNVVLGNSVKTIGANAFAYCEALESINIPKSVISIGEDAFLTSRKLRRVSIDDLAAWCNIAFESETANPMYYVPDQKEFYIGDVLATDITIPDGVQSINDWAFYNCDGLTSVVIPNSVTSLGRYAFCGCGSLASVTIPNGITDIGDATFQGCSRLKSITIPDSVTSIGKNAFGSSGLISVTIPGNVKTIGVDAFSWNSKLTSVIIENGVTHIGQDAFYECEALSSVIIPKSVTNIDRYAFYWCINLKEVGYAGSKSEWEAITKGSLALMEKVTVYYNHASHNYQTVVKEPTCTEKGYTAQACTVCGHEIIDESSYVSELGYKWRAGTTVAPTCTDDGYTVYSCKTCGKTQKEDVVAALGHTLEMQGKIEATCTESGYSIYLCTTCGETIKDNYILYTGHRYYFTVVQPTCEDEGYTLNSCYYCDYSYKTKKTSPKGHFWLESKTVEPTCSQEGYTEYTCKNCGETQKDDFVEALAHTLTSVVTPPTETVHGYTTHTCTVCGYVYKDSHVPATGEGVVNGVQNMQITATDTSITVTWNEIAGATKYNLYVNDAEGNNLITRALAADRTSVTLSWPNELEWDKTYTVGIRARTSKWLTTVYKDAALVVGDRIVDVKTQSVGRTIKVDWRAYEGATQYYVYVYEKGAYPTTVTSVKATTNSATIINAINPEVDYEVRVIATRGVAKMATADALSIDARLNVFTPDTFTERGITPTKVGIGFDEVRGADKYWVYLTDVNSGTEIIKESTRAIAAVGSLSPNTEYTVQIQARIVDADGIAHYSGKSAVLGTIKTSAWEDIGFTATETSGGVELSWNAPENAYGYVIYRSTNGGRSYKGMVAITDPSTTSYVDTKAKSGYKYAIVMQLQDDFVAAKSSLIKAQ